MSSYYTYQGNLRDRNKYTSTVQQSTGITRYFSSLDSEVYIGSTRIHEIVAIDFTISEPKLPIYGYNSFYANRIVSGRRTVQGTFAINFTGVSSLLNILAGAEDSVLASEYDTITYRCLDDDSTGLGIGNSDIFFKAFDLTISYGLGKSENPTYNGCYQTLVGVQIVEYRQALDTEGNPILDMYSFIAKDIRYDTKVFESQEESSDEIESTDTIDDIVEDEVIEPEYLVANKYMQDELKALNEKCANSDIDGFIVAPTFNYVNGVYFVNLLIDSINNNADKYTNVSVHISDQSHGINHTCTIKDLTKKGSSSFTFKDSLRTIGVQLYKNYTKDSNYNCQCVVVFNTTVDNQDVEVRYSTLLIKGEVLTSDEYYK